MEKHLGILEEAGSEEVGVPGGGEVGGLLEGGEVHPPGQDGAGVWSPGQQGREVERGPGGWWEERVESVCVVK